MTIQDIHNRFIEELQNLYDSTEIQAIFRYYIEIRLNIIDSYLFNDDKLDFEIKGFDSDLNQLKEGKPIQQIVGRAFFYDYFFRVNEYTLIPRPETEELIYLISEQYNKELELNVIDLGTGSGCIPITIKKIFPRANVSAIDISNEALAVAKQNSEELNAPVNFIQQDLLLEFDLNQKFDIIVSNPPYIRELEKADMHKNVLNYEPHLALFVTNEDPLLFYRRVAEFGLSHLNTGGKIFCEINQYLGKETKEMFQQFYKNVILHQDISGNDRIIEVYN
ncbi:peptide chain release factor N(5)-glutamine methyltransferase [Faecalibacter bovis]|uniref:peptide chain release factor N(5)-glutamine methyltransferase n=1 Tax=Faecalibacter bovis TaxID=2898187 RepID=A0ABX7XC62_9FLAO|nr:peptide chain release factor N(5)-glutamine methyltransferase [Faecalibacter bovis]QTV05409.1 peptide chain release factor N(5)-glutamine methyltransferase [Faecalibacter bovis]